MARGRACLFTRVSPVGLEAIAAGSPRDRGLTLEHAAQWLTHVGLEQPGRGRSRATPRSSPRPARALEEGVAALLDELRLSLDYYGAQEGASAGRAGRPLRARQRDPRPCRSGWSAGLGLPSRSAGPPALAGLRRRAPPRA